MAHIPFWFALTIGWFPTLTDPFTVTVDPVVLNVPVPALAVTVGVPEMVTAGVFVTANPLLVKVTVDPVTFVVARKTLKELFETVTVGELETVTGTVPDMETVDPVTENEEFKIVTLPIVIDELAVV